MIKISCIYKYIKLLFLKVLLIFLFSKCITDNLKIKNSISNISNLKSTNLKTLNCSSQKNRTITYKTVNFSKDDKNNLKRKIKYHLKPAGNLNKKKTVNKKNTKQQNKTIKATNKKIKNVKTKKNDASSQKIFSPTPKTSFKLHLATIIGFIMFTIGFILGGLTSFIIIGAVFSFIGLAIMLTRATIEALLCRRQMKNKMK